MNSIAQASQKFYWNPNRESLMLEFQLANKTLLNYKIEIEVKRNLPNYMTISYYHQSVKSFDELKTYSWEYGFVVPIKVSESKRVLRWERKVKFS